MDGSNEFAKYLLDRKIILPKPMVMPKELVDDPEKLERIGMLVKNNREDLELIIEARIAPLREELLMNAIPFEVLEIRRAIMEIATFSDDFALYERSLENKHELEEQKKAKELEAESELDNSTKSEQTDTL